jgi:hypothetical protein
MAGMIASLKAAAELTQLAINARDAAVIRSKVIELQGQIVAAQSYTLAAQADQSALLSRERELEKEVADLKAWDTEKKKYELAKPSPRADVFAYALKSHYGASEPAHYICPNCYEDGIKSILQTETRSALAKVLMCFRCRLDIYLIGHPLRAETMRKPPKRR